MAHVKNVAIVGVTGSVGKFITEELIKGGKHNITAITRQDSKAVMPAGVKVARVNYDDPATLVSALRGQEVLIITLAVRAPPDTQSKLIDAAAEAGVPWILPNSWGGDQSNQKLADDTMTGPRCRAAHKHIEDKGVSSWIDIVCSFWYEFSLGGSSMRYGFDFNERSVVFFDDGKQKINTTTWPQVGRAVAALLALKTKPDGPEDKSVTLSSFKNNNVYISSFCVSQKDMFDSVLRVTGTKEEDWKISYENSTERYNKGIETMKAGDWRGFGQAMYTRVFYPTGEGVYEDKHELQNERFGLPKEDLDEYTKIGIGMKDLVY